MRRGDAHGTVGRHHDRLAAAAIRFRKAALEHVVHAIAIHVGEPCTAAFGITRARSGADRRQWDRQQPQRKGEAEENATHLEGTLLPVPGEPETHHPRRQSGEG